VTELDALASRSLAQYEQAIRRLDEAARGGTNRHDADNTKPISAVDLVDIP
jgi:hypothetical protein